MSDFTNTPDEGEFLTDEDMVALAELREAPPVLNPTNDTDPEEFLTKERDYVAVGRTEFDAILSGPIVNGWGPGRYFMNRRQARTWCEQKYGKDRVQRAPGWTRGRWACLIKNLKKGQDAA